MRRVLARAGELASDPRTPWVTAAVWLPVGLLMVLSLPPADHWWHRVAWFLAPLVWVVSGLWASRIRPDVPVLGLLMVLAGGLATFALTGTDSRIGAFRALTWLLGGVCWGPMFHFVMAFPRGRLDRWGRIITGAIYATAIGCWGLMRGLVGACTGGVCFGGPSNVAIPGLRHLAGAEGMLWTLSIAVLAPLAGATLWRRWGRATPPARRVLRPVLVGAGICVAAAGLVNVATGMRQNLFGQPATAPGSPGMTLEAIAYGLVPLGFLIGLLRARVTRSSLGELVSALHRPHTPRELRDLLADALGDPTLQVGLWSAAIGGYLDTDGRPFAVPAAEPGRAVTAVEGAGGRLGVLVHDQALEDDEGLVDSVTGVARLALERARLHAALRAKLADVRASRARLVQAADDERRRLERDLHDGAQQRLVGLALALRMLEAEVDGDPQSTKLAGEATANAKQALSELRELARGLDVPTLARGDLRDALLALAERAPGEVTIRAVPDGPVPTGVATTAHAVCAELVAAGGAVELAVERTADTIDLRARCVAGAPEPAQLLRLSDRVEAIGGTLHTAAAAGGGVEVHAALPIEHERDPVLVLSPAPAEPDPQAERPTPAPPSRRRTSIAVLAAGELAGTVAVIAAAGSIADALGVNAKAVMELALLQGVVVALLAVPLALRRSPLPAMATAASGAAMLAAAFAGAGGTLAIALLARGAGAARAGAALTRRGLARGAGVAMGAGAFALLEAIGLNWRGVLASFAAAAGLSAILGAFAGRHADDAPRPDLSAGEAIRDLTRRAAVRPTLAGFAAVGALGVPTVVGQLALLEDRWGLSTGARTGLLAASVAVGTACAWWLGPVLHARRTASGALLLAGIALAAAAVVPVLAVSVALLSGFWCCWVVAQDAFAARLRAAVQRPQHAAAAALATGFEAAAMAAAGLFAVSLLSTSGAMASLLAGAAVAVLVPLLTSSEDLEDVDETTTEPAGTAPAVDRAPLLACHGLRVVYGHRRALDGVDLEVAEGELVVLLGTNGAGKSTLLRALSGLAPLSGGAVLLDGRDLAALDPERRVALGVGHVLTGAATFEALSVRESLRLAARTAGVDAREALAWAQTTFPRLADRKSARVAVLSGGERHALALAQTMIGRPRLLLVDELSHGLAPETTADLVGAVRRLHADGTTVVVVEQSLEVARMLGGRALFLERGRVRFDGSIDDLTARADLLRPVFLPAGAAA